MVRSQKDLRRHHLLRFRPLFSLFHLRPEVHRANTITCILELARVHSTLIRQKKSC